MTCPDQIMNTALFAVELEFWLELTCFLHVKFDQYHPTSMDAGMELNIVDGRFFPAIFVKD